MTQQRILQDANAEAEGGTHRDNGGESEEVRIEYSSHLMRIVRYGFFFLWVSSVARPSLALNTTLRWGPPLEQRKMGTKKFIIYMYLIYCFYLLN